MFVGGGGLGFCGSQAPHGFSRIPRQGLDIFETLVTVTPQHEISKILTSLEFLKNTQRLLLGNVCLLLGNERLLLGVIGVFGVLGISFCVAGGSSKMFNQGSNKLGRIFAMVVGFRVCIAPVILQLLRMISML